VEGDYYYLAVKAEEGWRAVCGKHCGKRCKLKAKQFSVAEAINAKYHETNAESRGEYASDGTSYIKVANAT